jgi:uncharacterized protein YggU (UPF0235/DUF167 family)
MPNAPAERVGPWKDGELQIRVRAPAVDGKANAALCAVLAAALGLPPRAVALARGATSRHKLLAVSGIDLPDATARLARG